MSKTYGTQYAGSLEFLSSIMHNGSLVLDILVVKSSEDSVKKIKKE